LPARRDLKYSPSCRPARACAWQLLPTVRCSRPSSLRRTHTQTASRSVRFSRSWAPFTRIIIRAYPKNGFRARLKLVSPDTGWARNILAVWIGDPGGQKRSRYASQTFLTDGNQRGRLGPGRSTGSGGILLSGHQRRVHG